MENALELASNTNNPNKQIKRKRNMVKKWGLHCSNKDIIKLSP
jgi:hypothetical protein